MIRPLGGGNLVQAVVRPVELVELGGSHREQRAALENLHLDAHLEHVGRGGHRDIGLLRLGEHPPDRVGRRCLHARLVDRSGHQVGRAHRQGGGRRPRSRDAAGRADAERPIVVVTRSDIVSRSVQHRRQHARWPAGCRYGRPESASAVMSSAIGIRVAHSACSAVTAPVATSSRRICGRRRSHELGSDLDPRDLGDDAIGRDDTPRLVAAEARHPIADHRQRQVEKRGSLDQPHPRRRSRSTTADSSSGSPGLWIRFIP